MTMISEWQSKSAGCDSVRPSGMDLYTGLPLLHAVREKHFFFSSSFFFFFFPRTTVLLVGPQAVYPFGMAD